LGDAFGKGTDARKTQHIARQTARQLRIHTMAESFALMPAATRTTRATTEVGIDMRSVRVRDCCTALSGREGDQERCR